MESNRKTNNYRSADINCYDLIEYYKKTVVNEYGINTSKSVLREMDNKILQHPKKFYNQDFSYDEK